MTVKAISFSIVCLSVLMYVSAANAYTSTKSLYLQAEIFDLILADCKSLFPHKKLLYSSRLQRWKSDNVKAINKGRADMLNLATMLGQSESDLRQQKVAAALEQFQHASLQLKTQSCQKIERL